MRQGLAAGAGGEQEGGDEGREDSAGAGMASQRAIGYGHGPEGSEAMGIFDRLRAWLRGGSREEQRYDRVKIMNMVDGTTIEGHEAVKAHFEKEQKLLEEHGESITFQVYRVDLGAKSLTDLQGPRLAEIKVPGDFVSGADTVAGVKKKLCALLDGSRQAGGVRVGEDEQISLSFNSRRMLDGKLFYADHFMLLPVWVQVLLHACDHDELMATAGKLQAAGADRR